MIKTHIFKTTADLIYQTELLLRKILSRPGNLMLSGGSTPYTVYNRIAADPGPIHQDRRLFLSDERIQPFSSDKNNAHNLMPLLEALNCTDRFIRVDTGLPPEKAAARFATRLEQINTVDIGLLGMGTDGHTAGFFTTEQARMKDGALTLHTERPDGMWGVSVTPAFLRRVGRIILLVTGESKRDIVATLLTAPQSIPAGIALSDHPNVELWTDLVVS